MPRSKKRQIKYKDYLNTLNKKDLIEILDDFGIAYKSNNKKASLEKLIMSNLEIIVDKVVSYFQYDEYVNMKLLLKKGGIIRVRINNLLLNFLTNLENHKIVIKLDEKKRYALPIEFIELFKKTFKSKKTIESIKYNTEEYSLILGIVDTYGVLEFNKFFEIYNSKYETKEVDVLNRIEQLANFYNEINVYEDKRTKVKYVANIEIKNLKTCKEFVKSKLKYAEYTPNELIDIYNFKYMSKFKTYKKLMKFISRNYYVEKGNYKIISKYILIPYLSCNQLNKEKSKEVLSELIDKYFEFNNEKHKNKFMNLIEDVALDYPSWSLKGHSERES